MYAQILLRDTPRIAKKGVGTKRRLSWCVARLSGVEARRSLSATPRRMAAEKRVSPAECRRRGVHGKLQQVQQEASYPASWRFRVGRGASKKNRDLNEVQEHFGGD